MNTRGEEATLLVNLRARLGRERLVPARQALAAAGLRVQAVAVTTPREAEALLRREVERGAPYVVVGGGDGTLSHAANLLRGTATALGVLPLGTGNTFARSVGVPLDLVGAAQVAAWGQTAAVDVGLLRDVSLPGERAFLNSVALGLSAEIARSLTPRLKRRLGLLAWPAVGLGTLRRHRALDLDLTTGTWTPGRETLRLRTHQLLIANGRYVAGPLRAAPDASVADHRLDVLAFGQGRLISLLRAGLGWTAGRPALRLSAREVTVRLPGRAWASIDGELLAVTRLDLRVQPGALQVRVPRGFDAGEV
ncbi:diacylglycerol/lipid kinase family protein [Deinococcus budaensis]|uniref:YegS/Rv2252/BmrU family lipid kinase n=1 Tax=Deinococcus budaensis TaxID=1665626 RepID=A0A7W8GG76_9DEIO|nr:diacylglycerol kinase family protein [Deinococcus budaensis]MBB5235104.1 YegS/Rv2252/BmrU family lipid kinase [Deinococcus budaensis]